MKQLIAPIAIIVALIAFFVIIDRKDFYSGDDVAVQKEVVTGKKPTTETTFKPVEKPAETKPAEVKTPETKSVTETKSAETKTVVEETKPMTVKPVETKPVAETKPTETKPVVETKPVETKPAETKPVKTTPVAEEKLAPAAEKLNEAAKEFALAEKERREPFFRLYQDTKLDLISFQGTIRATSTIPDPDKNGYDNCLYALFIEIDSLLSEIPPDTKVASEAIINIPILKEKKILEDNVFFPGDRVSCLCADYDTMPQAIQEIQISDDIQSYEHQQYYPIKIDQISSFRSDANRDFAKREITILPIQSLPYDEKADKLRSERIQSEIKKIEKELEQHGGSFASWKEEYKPIGEKYKQLVSESYSSWINDAFFAAGGKVDGNESTYYTKDYIESILPYKKYLKKNNIDLIIMRIPTRGDFAARVLASDDFQENPAWVEHYYECLKNDIEIVDPMPEMWNHRFDLPLFYYYTSYNEYHPFEGTYWYSSVVLGNILKRYQYKKNDQPFELQKVKTKGDSIRFIYPSGNQKFTSNIEYNHVLLGGNVLENLKFNSGSPFVFLSNSYFGKYLIKDLALPIYCAYQLQTVPDWYYQQSLGTSMLYNLISAPELLSNRRAVIMIGCSQRGLWGKIHELPKYILDEAKSICLEKTLALDSPDLFIVDREKLDFSPNDDGGAIIKANNNLFSFEFSVPKVEGKNICMIRINFVESKVCTFRTYDLDTNTLIESNAQISYGKNTHQDLFIPLSGDSRKIKIDFSTSAQQNIRNVELWYY